MVYNTVVYNTVDTKVSLNGIEAVSVLQIDLNLVKGIADIDIAITDDLTINKLEEMSRNGMIVQIIASDGSVLHYKANEVGIIIEPQEVMIARLECDRVMIERLECDRLITD